MVEIFSISDCVRHGRKISYTGNDSVQRLSPLRPGLALYALLGGLSSEGQIEILP